MEVEVVMVMEMEMMGSTGSGCGVGGLDGEREGGGSRVIQLIGVDSGGSAQYKGVCYHWG
jgi:hypothetical protein